MVVVYTGNCILHQFLIYRKLYYFKIYIRPFLLDPKVTVYLRRPYREVALNKEFIYKF